MNKSYYLALPVIQSGHFDNLVEEDSNTRVWVSRCERTVDGLPLVYIEKLMNGQWEIMSSF